MQSVVFYLVARWFGAGRLAQYKVCIKIITAQKRLKTKNVMKTKTVGSAAQHKVIIKTKTGKNIKTL